VIDSLSGLRNITQQEGVLQTIGEDRFRCQPQSLHEKSNFYSSPKKVIGIFKAELQQINKS